MTWEAKANNTVSKPLIPTENMAIGFYILFIGNKNIPSRVLDTQTKFSYSEFIKLVARNCVIKRILTELLTTTIQNNCVSSSAECCLSLRDIPHVETT